MPADGFDVDAWLDDYEAPTAEARLWPRGLVKAHADLEARLADVTLGPKEKQAIAVELAEVEEQGQRAAKVFTFRAVSTEAWANLVRDHPPTKAQLEADAQLDFNPETFPPAAVAASSAEPKLTLERAQRIRATIQWAEWQQLWGATLAANLGTLEAFPKSALGAAIARLSNGRSGPTSALAASPAAASSAGAPTTSAQPSNGRPSRTRSAPAAASRATSRSPRRN